MNDDDIAQRLERTNELLRRMLAEVAKTPSTHAIFVDAGYVYASAGLLVAGTEDRRSFDLDAEASSTPSSTPPARSSRTAGCCASTGTTAPAAASTPPSSRPSPSSPT